MSEPTTGAAFVYSKVIGWLWYGYNAKHRYEYLAWWDHVRAAQIGTRLLNAPLHRAG